MRKALFLIYRKVARLLSGHGIGRFFPASKTIERFIISLLKTNFAVVQGHKMFLDSKDSLEISICGDYEPFVVELVKKEVKKGDVVLDIGANIGYHTLIFAKLVGEQGKVFAFEPCPDNYTLLRKNVETNGYKNVRLVEKAVSNRNGKIKLYLSEYNEGDQRIYDSYDGRKFIEVEVIRLDDYFKSYSTRIDFIKIDIQGAEWGAVQGMSNLLMENKDVKIVTEFWPEGLKKFGIDHEEYLKLLTKHGYKFYHINELSNKIEQVSISKLFEIFSPGMGKSSIFKSINLLCMRK